tara:strand:+ start:236 stop:394 length:159 start_codon:yes stop_codon:yes gene_type:complete
MASGWKREFKNAGTMHTQINGTINRTPGTGKHFMGRILQRMNKKFKRKKKRG